MNVREIVKKWLQENGYEGLCSGWISCGCAIDDLMPCDELDPTHCEPGYKVPCPGPEDCENGGGCPWHISTKKPDKKED